MSQKMTFQRNLIGMQDLLLGTGSAQQTRGVTPINIDKINASIFPYDDNYTLKDKLDAVINNQFVDANNLPVYIATPFSSSSLLIPNVIWIKDISPTVAEVYFHTCLMFKFNPTTGDLILAAESFDTAKDEITAAYTAADTVVQNYGASQLAAAVATQTALNASMEAAWIAADTESIASLSLGTASTKDVGTDPLDIVQLTSAGKLPAVDGSNLTNLPSATLPVGAILKKVFVESTSATAFSSLIPRAGSAPANTVGTELLTTTITPTAIGNKLIVKFRGSAHPSAVGVLPAALLFVGGVFAKGAYCGSPGAGPLYPSEISIEHQITTTALTPIVLSIRVGPTINAGDIRWNDNSWGATGKNASLTIEEVKA